MGFSAGRGGGFNVPLSRMVVHAHARAPRSARARARGSNQRGNFNGFSRRASTSHVFLALITLSLRGVK